MASSLGSAWQEPVGSEMLMQTLTTPQTGPRTRPWRTVEWWLIVAAVAITPIDFAANGLVNPNGPDLFKWALRAIVWYLPLVLLAPRYSATFQSLRIPPISWLMLWAMWCALSVLWAAVPAQAFLLGGATLGITMLGAWYVLVFGWEWFATAATSGLALVVGLGFFIDLFSGSIFSERSVGLSLGPTSQGRLAAFGLVLVAGLIVRQSPGRPLWLFSLGLFSVAIWFTETRTAMAAALVGILFGGLRRLPTLYRRIFLVLFTVTVVALVVGLGSASTTVADLSARNDPTSFSGRTEVWPIALDYARQRPILGYGMGNEGNLFLAAYNEGRLTFPAGTAHNSGISTILGGGVIGFVLYNAALISAFLRREKADAWVFAIVPTMVLSGLTEAVINIPSSALIILAGALAAIARGSMISAQQTHALTQHRARVRA